MQSVEKYKAMFAEKLQSTGSMDAALLKVVWVAFNDGMAYGDNTQLKGPQHAQQIENDN